MKIKYQGQPIGSYKPNREPFFAGKGADPNAYMKGDLPQQVPKSSKMQAGKPPVKPKPVGSGGAYRLKREARRSAS